MIRTPVPLDERRLQRGENQRIYSQMRRFFAPSSLVPAPSSDPQSTGNRNTVLTGTNSVNSAPTDSATLRLNNGKVTWYYKTTFSSPPNVTVSSVGVWPLLSTTVPTVYLVGPGSNVAVVIASTDATDGRLVNLHAVGAPN